MTKTKANGTLPIQLQNINFGFVKLRKKSKIPLEKDWQNKPYRFNAIQSWVAHGFNYGVLGSYGDLIVIDADTKELDKVVKDKLPDTFTVKTPRCG
ncbi:MAG: bifunctional DNA primase/polymerase, partial [Candidatus Brocadiales bacterium]|nr:bifunctional DNA primase/polymerase [Candidatus Brocadiales bacterium]